MSEQPEALRLADALQAEFATHRDEYKAAAELRRLHEVNQELLEALKLARLLINPGHAYGITINAAIAKATGEQK